MPLEMTDRRRLLPGRSAKARLRSVGALLLEESGLGESDVTLALVDDAEMLALNRDFRSVEKTTDVLAFSQIEGVPVESQTGHHLGDVVISVPVAERQAKAGGWTLEEEMFRLLVHGFLHLLGFDHETGPVEARRMATEERRLFDALANRGFSCAREDPP
jgi:probable rRNA maturation factor